MMTMKRFLMAATVAVVSAASSMSANAFWGWNPFNWGGPWGGGPWGGGPWWAMDIRTAMAMDIPMAVMPAPTAGAFLTTVTPTLIRLTGIRVTATRPLRLNRVRSPQISRLSGFFCPSYRTLRQSGRGVRFRLHPLSLLRQARKLL